MKPFTLIATFLALTLVQDPGPASTDLGARVDRVVQVVDDRWILVGTAGTEVDRIHRWRRVNEIMTLQARQFETDQDAERHVKALVSTMAVPVDETLKVGSFAVRIEWGDRRSSVYLSVGRMAVVISAPSADLARRMSRQAAVEFADRQAPHRSAQR